MQNIFQKSVAIIPNVEQYVNNIDLWTDQEEDKLGYSYKLNWNGSQKTKTKNTLTCETAYS